MNGKAMLFAAVHESLWPEAPVRCDAARRQLSKDNRKIGGRKREPPTCCKAFDVAPPVRHLVTMIYLALFQSRRACHVDSDDPAGEPDKTFRRKRKFPCVSFPTQAGRIYSLFQQYVDTRTMRADAPIGGASLSPRG